MLTCWALVVLSLDDALAHCQARWEICPARLAISVVLADVRVAPRALMVDHVVRGLRPMFIED